MRIGSITTGIIADGLVFNMDAANRASTIPITNTLKTFNTINLTESGSFQDDTAYDSSTISPSYSFDGVDDRIILSDTINLGKNTFSMNFWLKRANASHEDGLLGADMLYGKYTIRLTTSNDVIMTTKNGNYPQYWYDKLIPLNNTNWQNIVINKYSSTAAALYVNSIHRGDTGAAAWANNDTVVDTIGAWSNNTNNFEGNIASIQFYNRALSANEILHNYNALRGRFE